MKLRTQLILAFLVLAVLPLGGLTGYSYLTSVNAFKKAAEAEATHFSSELERRFERITRVIYEEVSDIMSVHYDDLVSSDKDQLPPEAEKAVSRFYRDIENLTPYINSLEIAVPEKIEQPRLDNVRIPSSMRFSFGGVPDEAATSSDKPANDNNPEKLRENGLPVRPFSMRDRNQNGTVPDPPPAPGMRPPGGVSGSPVDSKTRSFIRELVFNQLYSKKNPGSAADSVTLSGAGTPPPDLYTAPPDITRPESSYIFRDRNFNFDSPLSIGRLNGLLKANINGPLLMKEVMQATMREGDIPFVLDSEGKVLTADDTHLAFLNSLSIDTGSYTRVDNNTGEWMISTRQAPRSGRTIGIIRPVSEELKAIRKTALINLSFGLAACILAIVAIYPISKGFTLQLGKLMTGVNQLSLGNLDVKIPVTTKNEFGHLAESFNQMAIDLKSIQSERIKHEGLKKELELCRDIQKGLLPGSPLKRNRAELQGISIPAREVGGDFFNYFPLPENQTALLIGDVSGKGVAAALLMANIQAKLQAKLPLDKPLSLMAEELDDDIFNSTVPENYLTLFVGILDYEGASLKWLNAGHCTQYLLRRDGSLEFLSSTGRPLGLLPGGGYTENEIKLKEGDTLFLFTDGLPDAENEKGDFFGEERLETILKQQAGKPLSEILLAVENEIHDHTGDTLATDDATMLVLRTG